MDPAESCAPLSSARELAAQADSPLHSSAPADVIFTYVPLSCIQSHPRTGSPELAISISLRAAISGSAKPRSDELHAGIPCASATAGGLTALDAAPELRLQ